MDKDLVNLSKFGFPVQFPHPMMTAMAAKLRVLQLVATNAARLHAELNEIQSEIYRRPFDQWHYRSFATILVENDRILRKANMPRIDVSSSQMHTRTSFQSDAYELIMLCMCDAYNPEMRLRQRMLRWRLAIPAAHVGIRAVKSLRRLNQIGTPRLAASAFRIVFNGWATDERMRALHKHQPRCCAMGCEQGKDSIEHYAVCGQFWKFACAPCPGGLGLPETHRSLAHFLLVRNVIDDDAFLRMAVGGYALARTIMAWASAPACTAGARFG